MTLTRRLVLGFSFLAVMMMVLPGLLVGAILQNFFHEHASHETLDIANQIQGQIRVIPAQATPPSSVEVIRRLKTFMNDYLLLKEGFTLESGFFIEVLNPQGKQLFATPNLAGSRIPIPAAGPPAEGWLKSDQHGPIPVMLYSRPLKLGPHETCQLLIAVSLVEYHSILNQLFGSWFLVSLVAMAITGLLVLFLANQLLKPLIRLTREVEALLQADLMKKENLIGLDTHDLPPDQIRQLALTFNTLLARLGEMLEKQQRFVSDASHEMRSPLTAIQGHAELLLKRGQSNPEILTEGLEIIRNESNRLGKLVEDLLLLAQLRHRRPQAEVLNLASVTRQVVESRQLLYENLSYSGSQPALMAGDQSAIRRIVLNLIDNALRFTPSDALIEVAVYRREAFCWLIVRDHGAGIPAAHLPHIFERFYRQEADRNRRQGGAGLGLPIVKELVEWHQGQIEVESNEQQGTVFTLRFPAVVDPHKI